MTLEAPIWVYWWRIRWRRRGSRRWLRALLATKDGDVGDAAVDNGTGDAGMVGKAMATLLTVVPAVELRTRRLVTLAGGRRW